MIDLGSSPQLLRVARFAAKHGGPELASALGLESWVESDRSKRAVAFVQDLEALGPTYVKFGQILASRPDVVPAPFREALARLHSGVAPFAWSEVQERVSAELGGSVESKFTSFDRVPLAAASIGQVHRARFEDRDVAVKVQRPRIREAMLSDLEALATLARLAETTAVGRELQPVRILSELRAHLLKELSYEREAANLRRLGHALSAFDRIVIPQPVAERSTARVLTMDFVEGEALDKADTAGPMGLELADTLFHAYLHQVIAVGFFHADPHPGNIRLTPDGKLAILDLGMVGLVPKRLQRALVKLLLALADGRAEDAAEIFVDLAPDPPSASPKQFVEQVTSFLLEAMGNDLTGMQVGRMLVELQREANRAGVSVPPSLVLLGKTLVQLEQIARTLDPGFKPDVAVRNHTAALFQATLDDNLSPSRLLQTALEADELVSRLPARAARVLELVANNELRVFVHPHGIADLSRVASGVATRISLALVGSALLLGTAMLATVAHPALTNVVALAFALGSVGMGAALFLSFYRGSGVSR